MDTTGVVVFAQSVTVTVARDVAWVLGLLLGIGAMTCALTVRDVLEDAWRGIARRMQKPLDGPFYSKTGSSITFTTGDRIT